MQGAVTIAEARERSGLRLVLLPGLPSPWSQAARGLFEIEGVDYLPVHPSPGEGAAALRDWTGQQSYPAAVLDDEPARSGWAEILLLAERLAPQPRLIPADPDLRARLFGYAHEICGEMGLGWCRRLMTIDAGMRRDPPDPVARFLGEKYGHRPDSVAQAPRRVVEVLGVLDALLRSAHERGGRYLLGELSALDVYWATFCNLIEPLPPELLPLPEPMRPLFTARDGATRAALTPALLAHRDFVYRQHLKLPVDL